MPSVRDLSEEELRNIFKDLCCELNMDKETEESAWAMFWEVSRRFMLENDVTIWICCALYAACRESFTPTVGGANAVVMGNCISLNNLLRTCNTSIYVFISNIKKWYEMTSLSPAFLRQIEKLERNFSITYHLFKNYNEIFHKLFLIPVHEKRITKFRSATKCSSSKLYDFCWCFYLCAKNENPNGDNEQPMDLVSSFHLLICCINLVYINVLAERRVDLINTNFVGLPPNWNTPEFDASSYCSIESLCSITTALATDALPMKTGQFKNIMQQFFRARTISGNEASFMDIISNANFEHNFKSLNSSYEQYVLSVLELDERVFLHNPNFQKRNTAEDASKVEQQQATSSLNRDTPYTRKHSLPSKEGSTEPLANATYNVRKLHEVAHITEPLDLIKKAGEDAVKKLETLLANMEEMFKEKFPNKCETQNRWKLSKSLYYYFMDKIVGYEMKIRPTLDIRILLQSDIFSEALIACCVEIVLEAYNFQMKFPWILDCFIMNAINFYKIIETLVRSHDGILTRDLIKHLNAIEEKCLDSLVWQEKSPLWNNIDNMTLPTYTEVDVECERRRTQPQLQSPLNSAYDTFHTNASGESARRVLFNTNRGNPRIIAIRKLAMDANDAGGASTSANASHASSTDTLNAATNVDKESGADAANKAADNANNVVTTTAPVRSTSIKIFFRKFYKLAWLRLKALCDEAELSSEQFLNEIWTIFEYSIIKKTALMKERHLDQILMCGIYIYLRVTNIGKPFTDIMKCYRKQPQSTSDIYRLVLMDSKKPDVKKDLIEFYNTIYVTELRPYALKFTTNARNGEHVPLSPHPADRPAQQTKPSSNHCVWVKSMDKNAVKHSPNLMVYQISKSPAKDLKTMNEIVNRARGKRPLPFDEEPSIIVNKIPKDTYIHNKIRGIMKDREEERT